VRVTGWKVWYDYGGVFSSKGSSWETLPRDGVQFVQLYFDKRGERSKLPYRRRFAGDDFYWHIPGTEIWGSCTYAEMAKEEIRRRYPGAVILRGRWTSEDTYLRIKNKVTLDYGQ
jgi:hypothetical protein